MNKITLNKIDPQAILQIKKKSTTLVLNQLIGYENIHQHVWYSHEAIARHIGMCSKTVRRAIKELVALEILSYTYRHRHTCLYRLNQEIYSYYNELKSKLFNLKRSSRVVLAIMALINFSINVRPHEDDNKELYNYTVIGSHSRTRVYPSARGNVSDPYILKQKIGKENRNRKWMDENGDLVRSKTLQEVSLLLKLTKLGECKLMIFPDKVLCHAWQIVNRTNRDKSKLLNHLFMECKKYCDANQLPVDYKTFYLVAQYYKLDANGPLQDLQKKEELRRGLVVVDKPLPVSPLIGKHYTEKELENINKFLNSLAPDVREKTKLEFQSEGINL